MDVSATNYAHDALRRAHVWQFSPPLSGEAARRASGLTRSRGRSIRRVSLYSLGGPSWDSVQALLGRPPASSAQFSVTGLARLSRHSCQSHCVCVGRFYIDASMLLAEQPQLDISTRAAHERRLSPFLGSCEDF